MELSKIKQRLEILWQEVEKLEAESPSPGGTTNYNELSNKPQIEGTTLSGNKTAAQLGLATSSALNTVISNFEDLITPDNITVEDDGELPSSIDSRLALHQPIMLNHTVYYFYDESGVDYNYFAVDISGAYPKLSYAQIFKENSRVHFYNFVTDTVPTNNSDNFITSGGTYTALANKQDSLSTAQLNAANSGITSAKVEQYDKDTAGLVGAVDSGAKNALNITLDSGSGDGLTWVVNPDKSVTVSGENTGASTKQLHLIGSSYVPNKWKGMKITGFSGGNGSSSTFKITVYYSNNGTSYASENSFYNNSSSTIIGNYDYIRISLEVVSGYSFDGSYTFYPMICTKAQWDVSHTYKPYLPSLQDINTWVEYECFYPAGAGSYFDGDTSSVKVKVNRALKRCVADISLTAIAEITTSTNAFNFGTISGISNNTEIRPGALARAMVVSKADNYTAVISKAPSNATLAFFVSAGTIASGTSFSCQLSWDFV